MGIYLGIVMFFLAKDVFLISLINKTMENKIIDIKLYIFM